MIEVEKVFKSYKTRTGLNTVLKNINFHVNKGDKIGILGCNGAGKSTLIRLLGGAELPTSGRIERGMSLSWPIASSGGFQGSLTGIDNLRFIFRVYGVSTEDKIPFVQEFSELGSYLHEPIKTYSSGMRSRLAFALSMAIEFDCYLIDEALSAGDTRFQTKCRYELFEKRNDRSIILVSHSPQEMRTYCSVFYVLHEGQLIRFPDADHAYAFYQDIMKR